MAEGLQDLFTALNMLKESAGGLAKQRAIEGANEEVQKIRATEANEADKRAQLQQISNNLTARLAGLGEPATSIQAVAGAIGPSPIQSAQQAFAAGATATTPEAQAYYNKAGEAIDTGVMAGEMKRDLQKQEAAGKIEDKKLIAQEKRAEAKAASEALKLPPKAREEIIAHNNVISAANTLEDQLANISALERLDPSAPLRDKKIAEAKANFGIFVRTAAKSIEQSRLSDADAAFYKNLFGDFSAFRTPEATLGAISALRQRAIQGHKTVLEVLEAEHKNVDALRYNFDLKVNRGKERTNSAPGAPGAGSPPPAGRIVKGALNGKFYKIQINPDGTKTNLGPW